MSCYCECLGTGWFSLCELLWMQLRITDFLDLHYLIKLRQSSAVYKPKICLGSSDMLELQMLHFSLS